jgi:exopolyphosphatase / guanosine-5'-triphosphate,3'-diphosphate pyrophosphatase
MLIAERSDHGMTEVLRQTEIVRLGQGVDRTGRVAPEALARTRRVLARYSETIRGHEVTVLRMVATSAMRNATNRDVVIDMVRDVLGVDPHIITGAEEAQLSFVGATAQMPRLAWPVLVVDIGGGSTELVLGGSTASSEPNSRPVALQAVSVDVGSVRLTERYLHGDPPSADEVYAAREAVDDAIRQAANTVPVADAASVVAVAGTATTLAAVALGLPHYDSTRVHGACLTRERVDHLANTLVGMTYADRVAIPVMHPGRADVIAAGAMLLQTVLRFAGSSEVIVSEHDILDGIALELL